MQTTVTCALCSSSSRSVHTGFFPCFPGVPVIQGWRQRAAEMTGSLSLVTFSLIQGHVLLSGERGESTKPPLCFSQTTLLNRNRLFSAIETDISRRGGSIRTKRNHLYTGCTHCGEVDIYIFFDSASCFSCCTARVLIEAGGSEDLLLLCRPAVFVQAPTSASFSPKLEVSFLFSLFWSTRNE